MAPRRYSMERRRDAVAATRARILEAAMALHASHGVRLTGWDQIAERAGVSPATVYRHFPTLEDLVPGCARMVFDIIRAPSVTEARTQFAHLPSTATRLEHVARESCHCYRRGEGWLHAAHRERDFVPALDQALAVIQDTLHVLVDAAAETPLDPSGHAALFVLLDFPFWKALLDSGLSYDEVEDTVVAHVHAELNRLGTTTKETP